MTARPEGHPRDEALAEWTEHLEELRRRIVAVLAVWCAATLAAFAVSDRLVRFLTSPVANLDVQLYTFGPAEKFLAHLNLSMLAGLAFSLPFCILQAGLFVWPALTGREKRYAAVALTVVPLLFLAGCAAAYTAFAPFVMRFFLSFAQSDGVEQLWGFRQYLSLLSGLMLAMGLLLQMPFALLALFALGLLSPRRIAPLRPYIVLLIFLAAAFCTPPDVASQLALGIPLYLLFELTLLIGRFIGPK